MKTSTAVATEPLLSPLIRFIAGIATAACLVWCAVAVNSLQEMTFWLLTALIALCVNLFGGGLISRMITSAVGV